MCAAYENAVPQLAARLGERFPGLRTRGDPEAHRGTAYPQSQQPVVRMEEGLPLMERLLWGLLPHWARDPRMGRMTYNARSETAPGKPSFRDAWRHRRCLVPVTGWYEWQDGRLPSGRITKTRYLISRADHALFFLGGLWESNGQVARDETLSFSIVTLRATPFVAEIHNADPLDPRMPLIVPRAFQERWLDPELADPAQVSSLVAACGEAVRGLEEEALAAVPRPREKPPSAQGSLIDY